MSFACAMQGNGDGKIIDEIPNTSLPFENECEAGMESFVDMDIQKPEESFRLIGKFPIINHNLYLLFSEIEGDLSMPIICVYDSYGELLQSFPLIMGAYQMKMVV